MVIRTVLFERPLDSYINISYAQSLRNEIATSRGESYMASFSDSVLGVSEANAAQGAITNNTIQIIAAAIRFICILLFIKLFN